MPRRHRISPFITPASATCCCINLIFLIVLVYHPFTVWLPPISTNNNPQQEKQDLLQLQVESRTHRNIFGGHKNHALLQSGSSSSSWLIFASAKGCCKQKAQAAAAYSAEHDTNDETHGGSSTSHGNAHRNMLLLPGEQHDRNRSRNKKPDESNMSHMGGSRPKPAHGGEGHGGGMPSCCGVMPMYFVNTTHTIILFKWWETLKTWQYALSVIICVLLGIFSVMLKVVRLRVEQRLATRDAEAAAAAKAIAAAAAEGNSRHIAGQSHAVGVNVPGATNSGEISNGKKFDKKEHNDGKKQKWLQTRAADVYRRFTIGFPLCSNCCRMIQAFILYGFDYLLMLIVMSYNVGLFFAVTGGLALGFFFFGHLLVSKRSRSSVSSSTHRQQNVEMQDFHAGDPLCCGA